MKKIILFVFIMLTSSSVFSYDYWTQWEHHKHDGVVGCAIGNAQDHAWEYCRGLASKFPNATAADIQIKELEQWFGKKKCGWKGLDRCRACWYKVKRRCLIKLP